MDLIVLAGVFAGVCTLLYIRAVYNARKERAAEERDAAAAARKE